MSRLRIVVEDLKDWSDFYPTSDIVLLDDYVREAPEPGRQRVINLCRSYHYQSTGYYCSLLAEARGHAVTPPVKGLGDLSRKLLFTGVSIRLDKYLSQIADGRGKLDFRFCFGQSPQEELAEIARRLFEQYGVPVLEATFVNKKGWRLQKVQPLGLHRLTEDEREVFANALDHFSGLIWRKPRAGNSPKYTIAVLVDPEESLPPSNPAALKKFAAAAKRLGMATQQITRKDIGKLAEFDGLFIRTTTSVDHYTYKFSRVAQSSGLVVIDDPESILRCTNKIYLARLLETNKIATPKSLIVSKADLARPEAIVNELGLPVVLKVPDGSFSIGVNKVASVEELQQSMTEMLRDSAFLIAQAYLYTEYDWRIGVLNNQPIYACRYYMAKNHWQIYNHGSTKGKSGGFDAMPTFEVPKPVLKAAVSASKKIGNGLYGVDIKQNGDKAYLIEINDNPSIESGVEDKFLGAELYDTIMREFRTRLDAR